MGGLAGAAVWPISASAQQPAMPVIGCIDPGIRATRPEEFTAFHKGLNETGYYEGQNLSIEYRWAEDEYERLPLYAAELVQLQVKVLVATGGPIAALVAKAATSTIPVVFTGVADPVKYGLVATLNRPGQNITGSAGLTTELEPKRLELLAELVPHAELFGVLVNPKRPNVAAQVKALQNVNTQVKLVILKAGSDEELDAVFHAIGSTGIKGILITADSFFNNKRAHILALAAQYSIPAIYPFRKFAAEGGLISYGASLSESYRSTGIYTGRILHGENPADLPVTQATKVEFVANLKTAKALGLHFPDSLLARADEVIE